MNKKSKKVQPNKSEGKDRVVYAVTSGDKTQRVEAFTTSELREQIKNHLDLENYAAQAVARLVSVERAVVTGKGWRVERIGVLKFEADDSGEPQAAKENKETRKPSAKQAKNREVEAEAGTSDESQTPEAEPSAADQEETGEVEAQERRSAPQPQETHDQGEQGQERGEAEAAPADTRSPRLLD